MRATYVRKSSKSKVNEMLPASKDPPPPSQDPPPPSQDPPPASQDPPKFSRRFCALAPHYLREPNRPIMDQHLLRFAQLINSEMRLGSTLCGVCYKNLIKLYKQKMENARNHQKKREEASSGTSMSDESSSRPVPSVPNPGGVTRPSLDSTSNDDMPSTSAAAAAKRNQTGGNSPPPAKRIQTGGNSPPPAAASSGALSVSDDDDPNSNLSLNAVNGTRLPHIQPIPKRREFVHFNKTAMDIYLAGTTGG